MIRKMLSYLFSDTAMLLVMAPLYLGVLLLLCSVIIGWFAPIPGSSVSVRTEAVLENNRRIQAMQQVLADVNADVQQCLMDVRRYSMDTRPRLGE